ncbi:MAG: nlhH [Myxococcaceae bacterium]|nr:nlhH [Myxococcaceae bacterium]
MSLQRGSFSYAAACASVACGLLCSATPLVRADEGGKPNKDMQTVLMALQRLGPKPIESLHPVLARAQPSASDGVIQAIQDQGIVAPDKLPAVGQVELKTVPGPDGLSIPVRVYTPKGSGPFPVIVYFHGGGWVLATLDTYDASARTLTERTGAVVVSVDYRRAPEHKFPAAVEDAYAALQYVSTHADEFHADPAKVAVAGESAGGNLATVSCLLAKQRGGKQPVHQVLVYPVTNHAFDTASYRAHADEKPLSAATMKWFFQQYLRNEADGRNVLVSPWRASAEQLRGLPPATIVTAELDPLRDDGSSYADKLKAAGVDTEHKDYLGVTHEFFGMAALVDEARSAHGFVAGRLKAAFADKEIPSRN